MRAISSMIKGLAGGDTNKSEERDLLMVDLVERSIFPQKGDSFDLVGKSWLRRLFERPKLAEMMRKIISDIDYIQPLHAQLRVVSGGASERACSALGPFLRDGFPSAPKRRRVQNCAVNEVTDSILRCGPTIDDARAAGACARDRN
jgi:hypothetical protein